MNGTHDPRQRRWRPRALAATAIGCAVLLAGGSVALATNPGQGQGLAARPAAQGLQQQVKALQSEVKDLLARVNDLEDYDNCEYVIPVRQWGDPQNQSGYAYYQTDGSEIVTSALDYVDASDFDASWGDEWINAVKPSCVSTTTKRAALFHARAK